MSRIIGSLQDLNLNTDIVCLVDKQQALESKMAHAYEISDQLEKRLSLYNDMKQTYTEQLHHESQWLLQLKEQLQNYDDTSASDEELVDRLNTIRVSIQKPPLC